MNAQSQLGSLINTIVQDPHLHARWLNTFSFLEYVGFRKIVKSQRAEALNATILGHAIEEGRHALGLKKLAIKLGGKDFDLYAPQTMLCAQEAEAYFQDLDHGCEAAFADRSEAERTKLTYLYVTWLIEVRALEVYGLYKQALSNAEIVARLEGLLSEEAGHLNEVEASLRANDPAFEARAREFKGKEAALYETFINALVRELDAPQPGAFALSA